MKVICAWCDKVLRAGSEPTSHGICEECAAQLAAHIAETLTDKGWEASVVTLKGE